MRPTFVPMSAPSARRARMRWPLSAPTAAESWCAVRAPRREEHRNERWRLFLKYVWRSCRRATVGGRLAQVRRELLVGWAAKQEKGPNLV
jgi:hypothetical protein